MSEIGDELTSDYAALLRQGPPFTGVLDFSRRCARRGISPAELTALHESLVGAATGFDTSTTDTLLYMAVTFRGLLSEIVDSRQVVTGMEQSYSEISTLYRTKSRTLSMVAHDLSSYLVSCRMLALSMVRDTHEEFVSERCRYILKALEDQEHLVANLLSIGKIESGTTSSTVGLVDLKSVITRCVESARKMSAHTFSITGPALQVAGDEDKLRQVMENLVGNAVKFSPVGGLIEIEVIRDGSWAAVSVRDHGVGIAAEDMPHVFEPYYRAVKGQTGGTGLGLSIVKSLVDMMQGEVRIESDSSGTRVHFLLPLA